MIIADADTKNAKCRVCGCTDENPCLNGCSWVLTKQGKEDLCSTCLEAAHAVAEWAILIPDRMTIGLGLTEQTQIGWPDRFSRLASETTVQLFLQDESQARLTVRDTGV
jgi:hypothetical protein